MKQKAHIGNLMFVSGGLHPVSGAASCFSLFLNEQTKTIYMSAQMSAVIHFTIWTLKKGKDISPERVRVQVRVAAEVRSQLAPCVILIRGKLFLT